MVPVVHSIILYGWHMQNERLSFQWMLVTLVLNATGAMAYVTKVCARRRRFASDN